MAAQKLREYKCEIEKELQMRDATPEEQNSIKENIKKISKPTGINFYDYLEEALEDDDLRKEYEAPDDSSLLSETGFVAIGSKPKIINGSKLTIGKELQCVSIYNVDQHFNWFQKLMWKWAFGIKVEDFSEV